MNTDAVRDGIIKVTISDVTDDEEKASVLLEWVDGAGTSLGGGDSGGGQVGVLYCALLCDNGELVFARGSFSAGDKITTSKGEATISCIYGVNGPLSVTYDENWNVTSATPWYSEADYITSASIDSSMVGFKPTSTAAMFYGLGYCTSITGLNNLDTSEVTDMQSMFDSCLSLAAVDVSGFDTSNVTDMSYMFYDCGTLEEIDASNFDMSNVTNVECMFYNCSSMTSLNMSGWDTGDIENMYSLFGLCTSLTSLDLSNWDTSKLTNMNWMFGWCFDLETLNLTGWDTSNVEEMAYTFSGDYNNDMLLTEIIGIEDFDVSNVWNFCGTFEYCGNIEDFSFLDTWDTGSATEMSKMFGDCDGLTSSDVNSYIAKLDTSSVQYMEGTLGGCSGLTSIINLSSWDTSSVLSMWSLFAGCTNLTKINVSGWNTSNVTNMYGMFQNCWSLETIYATDSFDTASVTSSTEMFYQCSSLEGGNGTAYDSEHENKAYARIDAAGTPGYFTSST